MPEETDSRFPCLSGWVVSSEVEVHYQWASLMHKGARPEGAPQSPRGLQPLGPSKSFLKICGAFSTIQLISRLPSLTVTPSEFTQNSSLSRIIQGKVHRLSPNSRILAVSSQMRMADVNNVVQRCRLCTEALYFYVNFRWALSHMHLTLT